MRRKGEGVRKKGMVGKRVAIKATPKTRIGEYTKTNRAFPGEGRYLSMNGEGARGQDQHGSRGGNIFGIGRALP